jgi:hypothetical protein
MLRRFSRGPVAAAACVPGLFGPLVVAMGVLWVFQWPMLRGQYDTAIPLALAHMVWLLPVALVLTVLLLPRGSQRGSAHTARLLRHARSPAVRQARRRLWAYAWLRPAAAVALVLFGLAYFELTATSILAPVAARPSAVAAYNNMHYGQNDVLSARVMLNFVTATGVVMGAAGVGWLGFGGGKRQNAKEP